MSVLFRGRVNVDIRDFVEDWTPFAPVKQPQEAPDVVYIVLAVAQAGSNIHVGRFRRDVPLFRALGSPEITAALRQKIIKAVVEEAGTRSAKQLAQEEDESLVGLSVCVRKPAKTGLCLRSDVV